MKTFITNIPQQLASVWHQKHYLVLGGVSFLFFLYFFFPIDKIRPQVQDGLETVISRAFQKPVRVELTGFDTYWVTGVRADKARVTVSESGREQTLLLITNLKLRINPLALLIGRLSISHGSDVFNGHLSGSFSTNFRRTWFGILLRGADINLEPVAAMFEKQLFGAKLSGHLSLDVDTAIDLKTLKASHGTASLTIKNPTIKASKIFFIDIPEIPSASLDLDANLKDAVLTLKKLRLDGTLIRAQGDGEMKLKEPIRESTFDIKLSAFFSDEIKQKIPTLQMLLGQRTPDTSGNYSFPLKGSLNNLTPFAF